MPRHPRVHLNGILHIVQRGHNREPCFFGEEDYDIYLHDGEALKETRCSARLLRPQGTKCQRQPLLTGTL